MGIPPVSGSNNAPEAPEGGKEAGGGKGEGISEDEYNKLDETEKAKYIEDPNNPGQYIPAPEV